MSADSFAYCPRCHHEAKKKEDHLFQELEDRYGKIPAAHWVALKEQYDSLESSREITLEEYYEAGFTAAGQFFFSYEASCTVCGYQFDYNYSETPEIKDEVMP